jgi:hypothetical protein
VRYNYACACALAGQRQAAAEALRALAPAGVLKRAEVEADPDLAGLRAEAWWQALLDSMS